MRSAPAIGAGVVVVIVGAEPQLVNTVASARVRLRHNGKALLVGADDGVHGLRVVADNGCHDFGDPAGQSALGARMVSRTSVARRWAPRSTERSASWRLVTIPADATVTRIMPSGEVAVSVISATRCCMS